MPPSLRTIPFTEAAVPLAALPEPGDRVGHHTQTTLRPGGTLDLKPPLVLPEDGFTLPARITPDVPPLILARLEGAAFEPGSGGVAPAPDTLLFEPDVMWPVRINGRQLGSDNGTGRGAATDWPFDPRQARDLAGPHIVLGLIRSDYLATWYHWLIEHLPRLHLLWTFSELRGLPVVTVAPVSEAQRQSLEILGLKPPRLLALPAGDGPVRPEVTYLPAPIGVRSSVSPEAVDWMAATVLERLGLHRTDSQKMIYVRRNTPPRGLHNDAELSATLAAAGFEIVAPETLSFADQVRCYRQARVVVSPHGAGLANTIFCRPDTVVVELTSLAHGARPSLNMICANLSAIRGLTHVFAPGGEADPDGCFSIDPAKVMRAVIHGLQAVSHG